MILFIALTVFLLLTVAFIKAKVSEAVKEHGDSKSGVNEDKPKEAKRLFSTKQLVFSGVALAIAFVLSFIKVIDMPWGGSVTLCSMLFVTIIGYWYGPAIGLVTALAYGVLQFVQDGGGYILSPMQVAFDFILAFMALGVSGFFNKKKNGLIIGYIIAILLRGLMHAIGGYIYWMDYMPDNFPKNLAVIYPILYNYAYIIPEGVITVVLLLISPVKKGIAYISRLAEDQGVISG
ncbi:MAG: energy-coupled thiamine transporter ThiT [Lachnospiraceae bacterium]|nr:energy-coupled thiamine transporter ThiT [Lachnospiraceae bacterium]